VIPTATQQLEAMRDTMARFILPVIPAEERFAAEQANLVLASINWLIDVNESQAAYELQEQADQHALAEGLLTLGIDGLDATAALKAELSVRPAATATLAELRAHNRALKALTAAVLEGAHGEAATRAVALFMTAATRQVAREQAYCRMTGLAKQATGSIEDVLKAQSNG
jgi:hypothetical protein